MKLSDDSSTLLTRVSWTDFYFFFSIYKGNILLEKGLQLGRHLGITDMSVEEAARDDWTSGWGKLGEKRLPRSYERGDAEGKEGQHLQKVRAPVAPKSILSRN